jgi:hypothetical protein
MATLPWPTFKGIKHKSATEYIEALDAVLELMTIGTPNVISPIVRS